MLSRTSYRPEPFSAGFMPVARSILAHAATYASFRGARSAISDAAGCAIENHTPSLYGRLAQETGSSSAFLKQLVEQSPLSGVFVLTPTGTGTRQCKFVRWFLFSQDVQVSRPAVTRSAIRRSVVLRSVPGWRQSPMVASARVRRSARLATSHIAKPTRIAATDPKRIRASYSDPLRHLAGGGFFMSSLNQRDSNV